MQEFQINYCGCICQIPWGSVHICTVRSLIQLVIFLFALFMQRWHFSTRFPFLPLAGKHFVLGILLESDMLIIVVAIGTYGCLRYVCLPTWTCLDFLTSEVKVDPQTLRQSVSAFSSYSSGRHLASSWWHTFVTLSWQKQTSKFTWMEREYKQVNTHEL